MTQVRIDSITGVNYPIDIYVADVYGNNRIYLATVVSGPVPPELAYTTLPPLFDNAPAVMVIVIDANNCEKFEIVPCTIPSTPTLTPTSTLTATPTLTPTQTVTSTPTLTLTPGLSPTVTPTQTTTPTVTPTQSVTQTSTPTTTPTITPTSTQTSTPTTTPTITPTSTQTSTPANTPTQTQTSTPANTSTQTPTPTQTPTTTQTSTPTSTETSTPTPTQTLTPTPTSTETPTPTPTQSQTVTPTLTPTPTSTETSTPTPTPTQSPTVTPTLTPTQTITPTPSATPAVITFAYLIMDVNTPAQRNALATYMLSQGSTWGGFNIGNPVGALGDSPLDVTTPGVSSGNAGMPNSPAITTVTNGDVIVSLGFLDDDVVASSVTAPTGYSLIGAAQYGTAGNGATVMAAFVQQPTAGATNPGAFGGTGTDAWVGSTFALRPIAGAIPQISYIGQTQSTTTSITLPTGLQENDLVIIASASDGTAQTLPQGYTNGQNGNDAVEYRWSYKFMGATPDTTATGLSPTSVHIAFVFRGVSGPVIAQQNFNNRFNAYMSYSGWGVSQPTILTAPISNLSFGVDAFGVPVVAGRFQTTIVSGNTLPVTGGQSPQAWYTWFVPTGATPGQAYTSLSISRNPTAQQEIATTLNFYNRVVNYSGSTNIPAGYYRVYTSYSQNGLRPRLNGQNFYFRGGNNRINL